MRRLPEAGRLALAFVPAAAALIFIGPREITNEMAAALAGGAFFAGLILWALLRPSRGVQAPAARHPGKKTRHSLSPPGSGPAAGEPLLGGSGLALLLMARAQGTLARAAAVALDRLAARAREAAVRQREVPAAAGILEENLEEIRRQAGEAEKRGESLQAGAVRLRDRAGEGLELLRRARERRPGELEDAAAGEEAAAGVAYHSRDLRSVVEMQRELARQAGMLAYNANIEAVKAGPAGRGLGVVAAEMNKLSRQTGQAVEQASRLAGELETLGESLGERSSRLKRILEEQGRLAEESAALFRGLRLAGEETLTQGTALAAGLGTMPGELARAGETLKALATTARYGVAVSAETGAEAVRRRDEAAGAARLADSLTALAGEIRERSEEVGLPRLAYLDRSFDRVLAHFFKAWFTRDSGCLVALVPVPEEAAGEMFSAIAAGELDATISCWVPGRHESYLERNRPSLDLLGTNLAGARAGLAVPPQVSLTAVAAVGENFDHFRGTVYTRADDGDLLALTRRALEEYGLDCIVEARSGDELSRLLNEAETTQEWLVLALRSPDALLERWPLRFLEDERGAFGRELFVRTVARPALKKDHFLYYRALQNFRLGIDDANVILGHLNRGLGPEAAARNFLEGLEPSLV